MDESHFGVFGVPLDFFPDPFLDIFFFRGVVYVWYSDDGDMAMQLFALGEGRLDGQFWCSMIIRDSIGLC